MNTDFEGVYIAKKVWLDDNLTPLDKVVFAELNRHGVYDLNTAELAEFCKCDEWEIIHSLRILLKYNYIKIVK